MALVLIAGKIHQSGLKLLHDRSGLVVAGCGTSGHGFKFGPLLGSWLASLALGEAPDPAAARFALGRFSRPAGASTGSP